MGPHLNGLISGHVRLVIMPDPSAHVHRSSTRVSECVCTDAFTRVVLVCLNVHACSCKYPHLAVGYGRHPAQCVAYLCPK